MILVFIFLGIFIGIVLSNIKIQINELDIYKSEIKNVNNYNLGVSLLLFKCLPVIKINIKNKLINNKTYGNKLGRFVLRNIKTIDLEYQALKINIKLGTDSISITNILVVVISVYLSFIYKTKIECYDSKKHSFDIKPEYNAINFVKLNISGVIKIKTTNIIKSFIYEKRRIINERASNRKFNENSYE